MNEEYRLQNSDILIYKNTNKVWFVVHRSFIDGTIYAVFCTSNRIRSYQKYIDRSTCVGNYGRYTDERFNDAKEKVKLLAASPSEVG